MISVIVCSKSRELAALLTDNIDKTIGVPFEMLIHDNSIHNDGICRVYNKMASFARYPILCFVHEDVVFRTPEWGNNLVWHFQEQYIGVIGIAGGDAVSRIPLSWSNVAFSKSIHLMQYIKDKQEAVHIRLPADEYQKKINVLTVDGVFMCVRKSIFDLNPFDEKLLKGFHGYDLDYSLKMAIRFRNYVVYDILLEHHSEGLQSRAWFESNKLVAEKWKRRLPASVCRMDEFQSRTYHWQSLHQMINRMYELRYHPVRIYLYSLSLSLNKYFRVRKLLSMNRLFFRLLLKQGKTLTL